MVQICGCWRMLRSVVLENSPDLWLLENSPDLWLLENAPEHVMYRLQRYLKNDQESST